MLFFMNPNEAMTTPSEPAAEQHPYEYGPLPTMPTPASVWGALLKQPGRLVYELAEGRVGAASSALLLVAFVGLAIYGVVVGSLSADAQYWIAPAKILLGSAAAALLCLPSLYVFLCMGGANARVQQVGGLLLAGVALMAVLLVSLAPIAWIFSQSTESVPFMAGLHLVLWAVAVGFGLRLLRAGAVLAWGGASARLGVWIAIYLVVCLQMMTTLRPIVGSSGAFFPHEKMFFLAHWARVLTGQ
jgi:hypothetical protein